MQLYMLIIMCVTSQMLRGRIAYVERWHCYLPTDWSGHSYHGTSDIGAWAGRQVY